MVNEYKLSYTAAEINSKLGQVEWLSEEIEDLKNQTHIYVNSIEECTDTSKKYVLSDGYIYEYRLVEGDGSPNYTNLANPSSSEWKNGYRISGTIDGASALTGGAITNIVSVKNGDVVECRGFDFTASSNRVALVKSDGSTYGVHDASSWGTISVVKNVSYDNNSFQCTINADTIAKIRFSGVLTGTSEDVIIVVNEDIDNNESTTGYQWVKTGIASLPDDYEERMGSLESAVETNADRIDELEAQIENSTPSGESDSYALPSYYTDYLAGKIETVKGLMDEAGANGTTWIAFSDNHAEIAGVEAMNGGNSGKLARKIMDECNIPFVLCLGDAQSNSPQSTEENAEASCDLFDEIVKPLEGRMYQVLGNHDGAWGVELANYAGIERYTYPYNFTREKRYNRFLQRNRITKVTKDNSEYFYIDDNSAKTRFICLNTSDFPYSVDGNGVMIPENNTMKGFSILQGQFDFLISALNSVEEGWHVAVFCHAPFLNLYMDIDSYARKVLKAYKNKSTYSATYNGQYGGTGGGTVANYTDLADHTSSEFLKNYRYNSSAATLAETGGIVTNFIPCKAGDKVHVKGLTGTINFIYAWRNDKNTSADTNETTPLSLSTANLNETTASYDSSVKIWTIPSNSNIAYIRISTVNNANVDTAAENLIITVNENIVETEVEGEAGWDALNINANFTSAKGELIGLFTGHLHADRYYQRADYEIDMMSVPCDGRVSNCPYMDAETYPEYGGRQLGTVYEQCLDVVVVNKATKTVNTVRIGAGIDRTYTY